MTSGLRLHDFLDYWARERPHAEFAVSGERRITYGQAQAATFRLANALLHADLRLGDRVGVLSKNCLEYPLIYLAASRVGVVPVPLNYRAAPDEWAYVLHDAGARLVLSDRSIEPIRPDLERVTRVVGLVPGVGDVDYAPFVQAQPPEPPLSTVGPEDDLYQMYTSGTTGHPRGAVLSQGAVVANLQQIGMGAHRGASGERCLVVAPMLHAGVVWSALAALAYGGSLFILDEFQPEPVLRVLDEEQIGYAAPVPTMLHALVGAPGASEREYPTLRLIHTGASPIAESTFVAVRDTFRCDVVQGYGLTECAAGATTMSPPDYAGARERRLSVGRPLVGTEVRIVDEHDAALPIGARGEIVLRGPQLLRRYWNQPQATAELLRGGWLHTGDVGRLDADGFLYIEDRVKDVIISGGVNVYPRMVERVLETHPTVAEVAVFGIPDAHWGERVSAAVVLRDGADVSEEALIAWCRGRLGGFQQPRSIELLERLPRTTSGKVLKRALRERYWSGRAQGIGAA